MSQLKPISRAVQVHLNPVDQAEPLGIPSADTIKSMHFKHKAVTSAYFSFLFWSSRLTSRQPEGLLRVFSLTKRSGAIERVPLEPCLVKTAEEPSGQQGKVMGGTGGFC